VGGDTATRNSKLDGAGKPDSNASLTKELMKNSKDGSMQQQKSKDVHPKPLDNDADVIDGVQKQPSMKK
jgi:hypothetical protein